MLLLDFHVATSQNFFGELQYTIQNKAKDVLHLNI